MTSECVRAPPPKKRTPRNSSPSVTPVAAKTMFVPGREVDRVVDAILVHDDAHALGAGPLAVAAETEAGLDLAAEAAQCRGRQHALRRAADAQDRVDAGALDGAG